MDVRDLNQKIEDTDFELTEKLRKEQEDRNNKIKELERNFEESLDQQKKFSKDFREKVLPSNHIRQ